MQSSPRPQSPVNNAASGSSTARPASPKPPGGPATVMRRKAAADRAEKSANQRPSSTRAAGAGGSSSTMLSEFFPVKKCGIVGWKFDQTGGKSTTRNQRGNGNCCVAGDALKSSRVVQNIERISADYACSGLY